MVCGPEPMVNTVWDLVADRRRKGSRIHFHQEKFHY